MPARWKSVLLCREATDKGHRQQSFCVALLVFLAFSLGCSEFVVIGILPEVAHYYQISLAQAGQLTSLYALTYAICTPVLALLTGRFKRFHVLCAYLVLFAVGNAVSVFAPNFDVLLVARVLLGSISGALLAVGVTYLPELVGKDHTSQALTLVYSSYSIALILATSLGKFLASHAGWQIAMIVTLFIALSSAALVVLFLPRKGQNDEPAGVRDQLKLLREPSIITGTLVFVFGIGSIYTFYGYVSAYLQQVVGLDAVAISLVLMFYGVITFGSNLLSGWISSRFGLRALTVSFSLQAAVFVGLYAVGSWRQGALVLIMVIALLMYLASIPSVASFMGIAQTRYPNALTLASSLEPLSFNVGISFGTFAGGLALIGPGIQAIGLIAGVLSVVAAFWVVVTVRLKARAHLA